MRLSAKSFPVVSFLFAFLTGVTFLGCGRMGPPLPPEAFAPAPIRYFEVIPSAAGVSLQWISPEQDRRGKGLLALSGYKVYRSDVAQSSAQQSVTPSAGQDVLGIVEDRSIADLIQRREEAVEARTPSRRVRPDPALQRHEFFDGTLERGQVYLYWIEPFSDISSRGRVAEYARVEFLGEASRVDMIGSTAFTETSDLLPGEEEDGVGQGLP